MLVQAALIGIIEDTILRVCEFVDICDRCTT